MIESSMTDFRKEKDFLGEENVPAFDYWSIHTFRAISYFRVSDSSAVISGK